MTDRSTSDLTEAERLLQGMEDICPVPDGPHRMLWWLMLLDTALPQREPAIRQVEADALAAAPRLIREGLQREADLVAALKALTADMDRAGGDGYGMPECPWCRCQFGDNAHRPDCELLAARAAIRKAEGR